MQARPIDLDDEAIRRQALEMRLKAAADSAMKDLAQLTSSYLYEKTGQRFEVSLRLLPFDQQTRRIP